MCIPPRRYGRPFHRSLFIVTIVVDVFVIVNSYHNVDDGNVDSPKTLQTQERTSQTAFKPVGLKLYAILESGIQAFGRN